MQPLPKNRHKICDGGAGAGARAAAVGAVRNNAGII